MSKLQAVRVLSMGAAGMVLGMAVAPESILALPKFLTLIPMMQGGTRGIPRGSNATW